MALQGAWGLREGAGSIAADSSGNGRDLTVAGSWVPGGGVSASGSGEGAFNSSLAAPFTAAFTISGWFTPSSLPSGGTQSCVGFFDGVGNSEQVIWAQRGDFGTPNVLQGNIRTGGLNEITNGALSAGVEVFIAMTYDGTNAKLYVGTTAAGVALVKTVALTGTVHVSEQFVICGGPGVSSNMAARDVRVYDTAEALAQIQSDAATPADGGTADEGTLAGTLPAFTGSATAAVKDQASLAGSLPAFTASAAAGVADAASVTGSLPAFTGAAAAGVADAVELAGSLPAFTAAINAGAGVAGELAGTLPAFTGAATAELSDAASLAGAIPAFTGSAAADVADVATAAGSLPAFTASFAGSVELPPDSAVLAGSLPAFTADITGHPGELRDITITVELEPDRWLFAVEPDRWTFKVESEVTGMGRKIYAQSGSRPYAWARATEKFSKNISDDAVQLVMLPATQEPDDDTTWLTPDATDTTTTGVYRAALFVGNTYASGQYRLWMKITDSEEVIVWPADYVTVL